MTAIDIKEAPDTLVHCPHQEADYVPVGSVANAVSIIHWSVPGKDCPHLADCFELKLGQLLDGEPPCWAVSGLLRRPIRRCQTCSSREACECDRLPLNRYAASPKEKTA